MSKANGVVARVCAEQIGAAKFPAHRSTPYTGLPLTAPLPLIRLPALLRSSRFSARSVFRSAHVLWSLRWPNLGPLNVQMIILVSKEHIVWLLSVCGGHRRSFPVVASMLWNSLLSDIQSSASLADFCHLTISTYLLHQSFPDIFVDCCYF